MSIRREDIFGVLVILFSVAVLAASSAAPPMPPSPEFKVRIKRADGSVDVAFRNTAANAGWAIQRSTNLITWEDVAWSNGSRWVSVSVTDSGESGHAFYRAIMK